jgi:very-short-patch-repair endonuclease
MHPTEALHRLGGVGSRRQILRLSDRADFERLVRSGDIIRDSRGRYSLLAASEGLRLANRMTGVLSHLSAAHHHGWEIKLVPDRPHLTFARGRNLGQDARANCVPHWSRLGPDDVDGGVTSKARTLLDCLQSCAFDEALCVADSALRHGDVTSAGLVGLCASATGAGARQARRVARLADGRAANPFESVLRALSIDVRGLDLVPQVTIRDRGLVVRPDLVDRVRGLVVEADSHTWHSSRGALRRDCQRYTALVLRGWTVIRFAWEDVMFEPQYGRSCLADLAAVARRPRPRARRSRAA